MSEWAKKNFVLREKETKFEFRKRGRLLRIGHFWITRYHQVLCFVLFLTAELSWILPEQTLRQRFECRKPRAQQGGGIEPGRQTLSQGCGQPAVPWVGCTTALGIGPALMPQDPPRWGAGCSQGH